MPVAKWVFKLLYYTAIRVVLSKTREMAIVQRKKKKNLPVAESRGSEERDQEDQDGCCKHSQGSHIPSCPGGSSSLLG